MQSFRSSLSHLAIAATLMGTSLLVAPKPVAARQPCGSFTINWGGTISQQDMLRCAVEYNTGAGQRDRYYLEIKKEKIRDNFQTFELSFPKEFDGSVNADKIRVLVNDRRVELNTEATAWDPDTPLPNAATNSQQIIETLDASATESPSPNTGGELVIVDGQLVFLSAAELAAQQVNTPTPTTDTTPAIAATPAPDPNAPRSRSLIITLAKPLEKESKVEIILDDVSNPSNGGMYTISAFARSQGAPLPDRLGAWIIDIGF